MDRSTESEVLTRLSRTTTFVDLPYHGSRCSPSFVLRVGVGRRTEGEAGGVLVPIDVKDQESEVDKALGVIAMLIWGKRRVGVVE
jgi:hypothetical protein